MHVLQETPEESFEEWANLHNKVYASDAERAQRLTVWLDNLAYIQSFNAKKASHWVRPNPSICPRFAKRKAVTCSDCMPSGCKACPACTAYLHLQEQRPLVNKHCPMHSHAVAAGGATKRVIKRVPWSTCQPVPQ